MCASGRPLAASAQVERSEGVDSPLEIRWHPGSCRECARGDAYVCAEELGEVRRVVESCPPGAFGGRHVGVGEQSFSLEHDSVVDELLRAAAGRLVRRPTERARGVGQHLSCCRRVCAASPERVRNRRDPSGQAGVSAAPRTGAVATTAEEGAMSTPAKPSIVFAHGIWADGSCFSKVILPLQAEGYEVMAAQYGLDSNVADETSQGQQDKYPKTPVFSQIDVAVLGHRGQQRPGRPPGSEAGRGQADGRHHLQHRQQPRPHAVPPTTSSTSSAPPQQASEPRSLSEPLLPGRAGRAQKQRDQRRNRWHPSKCSTYPCAATC